MRSVGFLMAVVVAVPLVGCQTNEQTGTLVGAGGGVVAGGLIGNALGGRTGAIIGAALGGVAGGFAGSQIGAKLDQRDRERAEAATRQALAAPPNRPVAWASAEDKAVRGTATTTQVQRQASGGECRLVRETAYIKGEEVVQNQRYCQGRDGAWAAAT
jgi:surface antigen